MWEHFDQIGGALTAGGVAVGAVLRLWGAIKKKFDALDDKRESQFNVLRADLVGAFNRHEELDQRRHEDNLRKFGDIRVGLARIGYRGSAGNGNEGTPP